MLLPTNLHERLHKLESSTHLLLERLSIVNRRLSEVERERDALLVQRDTLQEQNRQLQQQLKESQKKQAPVAGSFHFSGKNRKLVENSVYSADNPAELKDKLDEYIREIDQCIAYLSSSNTL